MMPSLNTTPVPSGSSSDFQVADGKRTRQRRAIAKWKSPDELDIVEAVGEFSIAPHAKSAILRAMAKRPITFPERKAS